MVTYSEEEGALIVVSPRRIGITDAIDTALGHLTNYLGKQRDEILGAMGCWREEDGLAGEG